MKMGKYILVILLIALISGHTAAQKKNKVLEKADEAFEFGEYSDAIELYKEAYGKISDNAIKTEIIFKTALSYRNIGKSLEAELWFKKAIAVKYPDTKTYLFYADALKMNDKFDDAVIEYQKYEKLEPTDLRGSNGIKSCELTAKWKDKPTRYEVTNKAWFNSPASDYSPVFAKKGYKQIYFTTSRPGTKGGAKHAVTGDGFPDIYWSEIDKKGKWSEPIPLEGETVNSEFSDGICTLDGKYSEIYFTRCGAVKGEHIGCKIMTATRKGVTWGDANEVKVAADTVSVGHPSISEDGLTLYFAADMPGGQGGKDIWYVTREKTNKPWGEAKNVGSEINTAGDEVFPFIHLDGTLYFSSDFHLGMGGLDIFKAEKDQRGNLNIRNMRYPINSSADDYGICFEGGLERGFLTSKRHGGKGKEDIYFFLMPPLNFVLSGYVKDEKTDETISGAKVKLIGGDGSSVEVESELDGSYKFELKAQIDYQIITTHTKYLNGKGRVSTKGYEEDKKFTVDVLMAPIEKPIELQDIMYDLNKWDLRPESMVSLDKLVETLVDNPNIVIELGSHTDSRGNNETNIELSQKRAQSVVDFLIEKGISPERLVAKGYGEDVPATVSKKYADQFSFLNDGDVLSESFIMKLASLEQEAAHQINRRTEFKVLSTTFQGTPVNKANNTPPKPE